MKAPSRMLSGFLAVGVVALAAGGIHELGASPASAKASVSVSGATTGRAIPSGFVGLSIELKGLSEYSGTNPRNVNTVFEQELRNLSGGGSAALRIGGDGSDWSWWPVAGMARPGGVKYNLTSGWMGVAKAVAQSTDARLILGINLEADSTRLAAAEGKAMVNGIGSKYIKAFEIGNEPELYGSFSWYKNAAGQHIPGRPASYNFTDYLHDFSNMARALPRVPLAGPSTGAPAWMAQLHHFLAAEPRVGVVTLHRYPLKHCTKSSRATIGELLAQSSSHGLADSVAHYVGIAHGRHAALRIDELNAVSCGGQRGVSDTFASALWALDTLFEFARVGVDGVNFHTVPSTINELVSASDSGGRWHSYVHPQYYGMMMFSQAAPVGSRLLRVSGSSGSFHVWGTRAPNGTVHVVLINEASGGTRAVTLRIASQSGTASLVRLQAPGLAAKRGVTLGGQSFGNATYTGR